MKTIQSAERVSQRDSSDNYVFQRSILAYHYAAGLVSGDVLEIGTGSGYGISVIAPRTASFITIDKFANTIDISAYHNVEFHQMKVPPIKDIANNSVDFVITFQVIEHIKRDFELLNEVYRVLRPGGKLIISTPNIRTSLTRNPWHVREYTVDEFKNLLGSRFHSVEALGVFGNAKVLDYYEKNRQSVENITRFDIFNMQHWLPRWILKIPYDLLNRINRRRLLVDNRKLTTDITMDDYFLAPADDSCFDLYYIAQKS